MSPQNVFMPSIAEANSLIRLMKFNKKNLQLNGVSDVSPETAVRLSGLLGGSAESWLTLQESYDLW